LVIALGFFAERIRGQLQRYRATKLRPDLLAALLSRTVVWELRGFYEGRLNHQDLNVRILAHAASRELQPQAWITQRLFKDDHPMAQCAARNLVDLFPTPKTAVTSSTASTTTQSLPGGDAGPELIQEPEGNVAIPEDAPMDAVEPEGEPSSSE